RRASGMQLMDGAVAPLPLGWRRGRLSDGSLSTSMAGLPRPTPRLAYCLADCLAECQHEAVAVLDDHLSLAVNPILRTLQDLCTALAEVGGEVVDAVHVQVDIISFAAARDLRFIGAVEVDGNLIAPDN